MTQRTYGELKLGRGDYLKSRQGWFFRSTTDKVGDWVNRKSGAQGSTYSGKWERLYTRPTAFPVVKRIDEESGSNALSRDDWGSTGFWKESYEVLSSDIPKVSVYRASPSRVYADWEGHLYPSIGCWNLVNSLEKPVPRWTPFVSEYAMSAHELAGYGPSAIADCLPSLPSTDVATFVGEAREGLFKLPLYQILSKRNVADFGGEYLNYRFGIEPTLRDVSELLQITNNLEKELQKVKKAATTHSRRRRQLLDEVTTDTQTVDGYPFYGEAPTVYDVERGVYTKTTTQRRKVWFSGAFKRNYTPTQSELFEKVRELNRVYGLRPTPEMFYNLTPFSWLADWFLNTGDLAKNLSYLNHDGWYMQYGYLMCHTEVTVTESWSGYYLPTGTGSRTSVSTTMTRRHVVKQRQRALPYAFGWDFDGLSAYQQSILAALGMSTRGARSLQDGAAWVYDRSLYR